MNRAYCYGTGFNNLLPRALTSATVQSFETTNFGAASSGLFNMYVTMSALFRNSVADINISFIGLHMNFILKAAFLADVYIENLNFLF